MKYFWMRQLKVAVHVIFIPEVAAVSKTAMPTFQ